MPRAKFTDVGGAWQPLQETERLDSYYHHCQKYRVRREVRAQPPLPRPLYGISADSLCMLPEVVVEEEEPVAQHVPVVLDLPPVKVYATHYEPAVRGAPDLPVLELKDRVMSDVTHERRVVTFKGTLRLALQSPTPWATVKYTTDGAPVSARSSAVYQDSLHVDCDTTLRVASCKRGWLSPELQVDFVREDDESPADVVVEVPPVFLSDGPPVVGPPAAAPAAETSTKQAFVRPDVPRNDEPRKKRQASTVTPIKV